MSAGLFDPTATYEAVAKRIAELDARHKASPTKSGDPRASIEWPCLCQPLDWTAPPGPPPGVVDDPFTSATIGVAGWVADLADAWATAETLRLSRKHLNDGEVAARPLLVELVEARSE